MKNIQELKIFMNYIFMKMKSMKRKPKKMPKKQIKSVKKTLKKTMGKKQKKNCNGLDAAGVCDCLPKKKEPGPFSEWKN